MTPKFTPEQTALYRAKILTDEAAEIHTARLMDEHCLKQVMPKKDVLAVSRALYKPQGDKT